MKLLIKFDKDWADEFDVYGLAIMTECEWQTFVAGLPDLTYGFGTNEGWEEPGDFDESDFEVIPLVHEDEKIIRALLFREGKNTYGNFPH